MVKLKSPGHGSSFRRDSVLLLLLLLLLGYKTHRFKMALNSKAQK